MQRKPGGRLCLWGGSPRLSWQLWWSALSTAPHWPSCSQLCVCPRAPPGVGSRGPLEAPCSPHCASEKQFCEWPACVVLHGHASVCVLGLGREKRRETERERDRGRERERLALVTLWVQMCCLGRERLRGIRGQTAWKELHVSRLHSAAMRRAGCCHNTDAIPTHTLMQSRVLRHTRHACRPQKGQLSGRVPSVTT